MPENLSEPGSKTRLWAAGAALLVALLAVAVYAFHERNAAQQLAAQNSSVTSSLNATRDQVSALITRLDALTAQRAAEKSPASHPTLYLKPLTGASMRHRMDDPRWKKIQGQLDEQAKQIDSTR